MTSKHSIYHDLVIKSNAKEVFNAITTPKEPVKWWPLRCDGSPSLNAIYNFYFSEEYNWYGIVTSIENNKQFFIKMTSADTDWNNTTFGFELNENDNTTQVSFLHVNWPECNQHFKRSSFCWAMLLNGLKNYIEKGIVIPFEGRA